MTAKPKQQPPRFLSVSDLAERWALAPSTVNEMFRAGKLPGAFQLGGKGGRIRIPWSAVEYWEDNRPDKYAEADIEL